jgi:hypothetical protein
VLRTVSFLRSLQRIVETLLGSLQALGSIVLLMLLLLYIFAVVGRSLYAHEDPKHFGDLGRAMFSLFSFITLDNWNNVWRNATDKSIYFFLFFFIILEAFVLLKCVFFYDLYHPIS